MSWSVNIGSIAGTAIRIHITFLLFLIWIFAAGWASGGPEDALTSLVFMILLFACVLAHEFGHIFMARAFGVATPDVTLLPIGGVARQHHPLGFVRKLRHQRRASRQRFAATKTHTKARAETAPPRSNRRNREAALFALTARITRGACLERP
jgi:Zn-dependent protease